jgi:large subunit ribosomal protein L16
MLLPKRTKYRRPHSTSYEGKSKGGKVLDQGDYGLVALKGAYITNKQIEAARICLSRYTKRQGKIWIKIFPHLSKTKKPAEVRMGSGKGAPDSWVAVVKAGRIMFEMAGIKQEEAFEALRLASHKLPIPCKIIAKTTEEVGE